MPRGNRISDADFDEVSTVDTPAHQNALFVLAKRALPEEHQMNYFDADGEPVDIDELPTGTVVQNEDQQLFQVTRDDEPLEGRQTDEGQGFDGPEYTEREAMGKSIFLEETAAQGDQLMASLSKSLEAAITDVDTRNTIAKAFADQQVALVKAQRDASDAMTIAKQLRDHTLEQAYIAKAADFTTTVAPEVLGPVLKRASEQMSRADCEVIKELLVGSTDIFKQHGLDGDGGVDDVFTQVEKALEENAADALEVFSKSGGGADGRTVLSKEGAVARFFDTNPSEYSRLKRDARRG